MEHVADLDRFAELAGAAQSIFSYVNANPLLQPHALEFEYGMLDRQSARAVAKFSCVNCSTCHHGVVWVTAITQLDGTWTISHSIGWME